MKIDDLSINTLKRLKLFLKNEIELAIPDSKVKIDGESFYVYINNEKMAHTYLKTLIKNLGETLVDLKGFCEPMDEVTKLKHCKLKRILDTKYKNINCRIYDNRTDVWIDGHDDEDSVACIKKNHVNYISIYDITENIQKFFKSKGLELIEQDRSS